MLCIATYFIFNSILLYFNLLYIIDYIKLIYELITFYLNHEDNLR